MGQSADFSAEGWERAVRALRDVTDAVTQLEAEREIVSTLRRALSHPSQRRTALLLLGSMDVSLTLAVLDAVLEAGLSHRDAVLTRELLGRVAYQELERDFAPRALARLNHADDDEYRRIAELLAHLGLRQALRELCERAAANANPSIREIAKDFEQ